MSDDRVLTRERPRGAAADACPPVSLDMARNYEDIRRLVCAHPAYRHAVQDGHDAEDVLQDVLLRLASRQMGKSRWDPRRKGLGGYVWMVTRCAVSNYRRDHPLRVTHVDTEHVEGDATGQGGAIARLAAELGLTNAEVADLEALVAGDLRRSSRRGQQLLRRLRLDGE